MFADLKTRSSMTGPIKRRKPKSDHRKALQKAYNSVYRLIQKRDGVPTRREMSEAIMRIVIRDLTGPSQPVAREILRSAGQLLQQVRNPDGTPRYEKRGILHRWEALAAELAMKDS